MSTSTLEDIGARIAGRLEQAVGERRYAIWFNRSACFEYEPEPRRLRVEVPNRFVAEWIEKHFAGELKRAAREELGEAVELDLQIAPDRFGPAPAAAAAGVVGEEAASRAVERPARGGASGGRSSLRHRLEEFIVGPSNELAYAAAERLADEQADAAHPLFLHGGCGLGKTHLLQGICHHVLDQRPNARVLYTTGEQFTNQYIQAVRSNGLDAFRKRIRRLDLLAVDDVHFIANKQATQQEFLHSFDQIELGGSRVVLASDSHPKLINQFSEALVSRCIRGLVIQIHPPDPATREQLVRALAARRELTLEEGVVRTLVSRTHGSVREIEGMLTKLHALARLGRGESTGRIGHGLVERLFQGQGAPAATSPMRFETLLHTVAQRFALTPEHLLSSSRQRNVVLARSVLIHLARRMTAMSYPEIAAAMSRRNHSTIITAAQRIDQQLAHHQSVSVPREPAPLPLRELIDQLEREAVRHAGSGKRAF